MALPQAIDIRISMLRLAPQCFAFTSIYIDIRECGSTLYVGMAQGVSFSLYIGIGAKFENTQKTGERRLRTAEYRMVLL